MIYDIMVFENLRFRPFTARKREANVFKSLHFGKHFDKMHFR